MASHASSVCTVQESRECWSTSQSNRVGFTNSKDDEGPSRRNLRGRPRWSAPNSKLLPVFCGIFFQSVFTISLQGSPNLSLMAMMTVSSRVNACSRSTWTTTPPLTLMSALTCARLRTSASTGRSTLMRDCVLPLQTALIMALTVVEKNATPGTVTVTVSELQTVLW